jgi:perosamine synthetase
VGATRIPVPLTMSEFIALHEPEFLGNEQQYLNDCIETGWVSTAGKYVEQFEEAIRKITGAKYAVACTSGSAALHLALTILKVDRESEVIVPTITFVATINAVHYVGAHPVFMDCDPLGNIDVEKTIQFIRDETTFDGAFTRNNITGRRVIAIIPVHIFGTAVWLDELVPLCKERNIDVIEDAAESLGTRYRHGMYSGRHTGTVGDVGCLSFNGNKVITSGGGGMILTDDATLASRTKYLSTQAKDDPVAFTHDEIGFNYRLSNLQAAVGLAQVERLSSILSYKRNVHEIYSKLLRNCTVGKLEEEPTYSESNHWLNRFSLNAATSRSIGDVIRQAEKGRIEMRPVWKPNHLQKPNKGAQQYRIERAPAFVQRTLCLPSSAMLNNKDVQRVVDCING